MRCGKIVLVATLFFTPFLQADAPPATATLFHGRIEFAPPGQWTAVKSPQANDIVAIYIADDHDGYLAIQVLPDNAAITPDAARKIVGQLKVNHKKAGQEIVQAPAIEKDPRFAIKIHERYKTRDGKIADETHLYRQVAGKAVELDVQSLSEDQVHLDAVQHAGEEMLVSAQWKTPAPKKK